MPSRCLQCTAFPALVLTTARPRSPSPFAAPFCLALTPSSAAPEAPPAPYPHTEADQIPSYCEAIGADQAEEIRLYSLVESITSSELERVQAFVETEDQKFLVAASSSVIESFVAGPCQDLVTMLAKRLRDETEAQPKRCVRERACKALSILCMLSLTFTHFPLPPLPTLPTTSFCPRHQKTGEVGKGNVRHGVGPAHC